MSDLRNNVIDSRTNVDERIRYCMREAGSQAIGAQEAADTHASLAVAEALVFIGDVLLLCFNPPAEERVAL